MTELQTRTKYTYDANGRRVHHTGYTATTCTSNGNMDYVYDLSDRWVIALNGNGTLCADEIYAGSRHIGSNRGNIQLSHVDWLGTERVRINNVYIAYRNYDQHCTSLPFGDGLACTGTSDPGSYSSPLHFTGKERDFESGLDYFGARFFASSSGRFMSPDWSAKPQGVPYAVLSDPQSLNLYAYVRNNTTQATDPNGHWCIWRSRQYLQPGTTAATSTRPRQSAHRPAPKTESRCHSSRSI